MSLRKNQKSRNDAHAQRAPVRATRTAAFVHVLYVWTISQLSKGLPWIRTIDDTLMLSRDAWRFCG